MVGLLLGSSFPHQVENSSIDGSTFTLWGLRDATYHQTRLGRVETSSCSISLIRLSMKFSYVKDLEATAM